MAGDERAGAVEGRDQAASDPDTRAVEAGLDAPHRQSTSSDGLYSSARHRRDAVSGGGTDLDVGAAGRDAPASDEPGTTFDRLTGARPWNTGFVELRRDATRAARTRQRFVLAFVDVDGLTVINDSHGRASGDRVLQLVGATLRANLRSYDLVVRFGGDEFICGISDLTVEEAAKRLSAVNTALALSPEHATVSVGLAELQAGDTLDALIARADASLYEERQKWR